jgi:hypothetical protein
MTPETEHMRAHAIFEGGEMGGHPAQSGTKRDVIGAAERRY